MSLRGPFCVKTGLNREGECGAGGEGFHRAGQGPAGTAAGNGRRSQPDPARGAGPGSGHAAALAGWVRAPVPASGQRSSPAGQVPVRAVPSGQCRPGDPLDGVYLPFRLQVKSRCVTVRGRVDCVRREPDGDVHIELRLNRAYRHLLTAANAYQRCPGHRGPHLVVEIIPQSAELPFTDNSATRAGFVTPKAPRPGRRVKVTGPYVWDTNALHDLIYPGRHIANWAEVHPAWNVTVIRRSR